MRVAVFDTHKFEKNIFESVNSKYGFELVFLETRLNSQSAGLAAGFDVVCAFANDQLNEDVLRNLSRNKVSLIALRSAGFNHVDLKIAKELNLPVVRVPAYSPYSVAEHAVAMLLTLNRKTHRAYQRVRELNFSLDGLVGFDLHGKTVGIVGTGRIGSAFAHIMNGFGCKLLAYDTNPDLSLSKKLNMNYVETKELFERSDVISLHVPLNELTTHFISVKALSQMKKGAILINTGRGRLVDSSALITSLKKGQLGGACLDVYEEEENVFFQDQSGKILQDDVLARLLTFPNVLITSHQGFLTEEALHNIVETTLENIHCFQSGAPLQNQITVANLK